MLDLERRKQDAAMESAISLKYSGMSIEASKADYTDYADLGLVCEYCHAPVFLVKSRKVLNQKPRRTSNGKLKKFRSYKTKPYFAHFKSEDDSNCLLRTNSHAALALKIKSSTNSKQQRLEIFTSRIKQILSLSPRLDNARMIDSLWQRNFSCDRPKGSKDSFLRQQVAQLKTKINFIKEVALKTIEEYEIGDYSHLNYLNNAIEIELHQQATIEAIDYLCSDSGYRLLAWLYRITAVEVNLCRSMYRRLLQDCKEHSPELENFLVFRTYILQTAGIFGFIKHKIIDRTILEQLFANTEPPEADLNRVSQLIGAIAGLTPWKTGFSIVTEAKIPRIESYFIISPNLDIQAYLVVDSKNSKLNFEGGRVLDLLPWSAKIASKLFKHSGSGAAINARLPEPLDKLSFNASPCWLDRDEIIEFSLSEGNKIVAEIKFWRRLNVKNKKYRSKINKFFPNPQQQEIAVESPTAISIGSDNLECEKISLKILNNLLCCWNDVIAGEAGIQAA